MSEKIVTIILARMGSERFPNKNIAPLFGIPLYLYTVEHARQLGYPCYFVTDYNDLYLPEFVNVVKEKKEYATGDHNQNAELIKSLNLDADIYILLQITSPFRNMDGIRIATDIMISNEEIDIYFSVSKPIKKLYYHGHNEPVNFKQKDRTYSYTGAKEIYQETGSYYIFRKRQLNKKHIMDGRRYSIQEPYNIDIDTQEDLLKIEGKIIEY